LIRTSPVRLIDENNEQVGVVATSEALERAREAGLDLVEISADKGKANKARSKTAEMKEVRLGRSMKIDPHDIQIRLNQARRFLMDGHKVQIVQNFRGREMVHRHRGTTRMNEIIEQLADISKVEMSPRQAGRRMTMMLAPDKPKIEQIKRRAASIKQQKEVEAAKRASAEAEEKPAAEAAAAPEPPAAPVEAPADA
jgi:translation initiation factor IF-3